jgi:hypothetical protein
MKIHKADSVDVFRVSVTPDLVNEWLDSFDPSIRTFAANFSINVLCRYDFDHSKIAGTEDEYFSRLLSKHFFAFLRIKFEEQNPGHILHGISLPEI